MSAFFKVLNTASGGTTIDDENSSTQSTYSSFHINELLNSLKYENLNDLPPIGDINDLNPDIKSQLQTLDYISVLNFLFQSGNSVKQNVVTALIAKGASVTTESSWENIISAIGNIITGGPDSIKQITKLNITASTNSPDVKTVNLDAPVSSLLLATSVLLFIPGLNDVIEHICGYDNSESSNFIFDSNFIIFDGEMKPLNSVTIPWVSNATIGSYDCSEVEIDESLYKTRDSITDTTNNLIIGIIPKDQVILGKGDIDLTGIQTLKSISISSAGFRFALSFDGGGTYNVWNGTSWVTVDINNMDDIKAKFMTKTLLDSLTDTQLEVLRDNSTKLRIAYFPDQSTSSDSCYTDQLDITVDEPGYDEIAPQANWSYQLLDDKQTIQYTFTVAGTYTINYI